MSWRTSSASPLDRLFACLPYVLPMLEALPFGTELLSEFPMLQPLLLPLYPFAIAYSFVTGIFSFGGFGIGGFLIFLAMYFFVVRNESISHFIRFNTMQSILIGIVLSLFSLVLSPIIRALPPLFLQSILTALFLGTFIACIYAIVQSALGRYAEIPTLSDAAHIQVR
ncbi:MAG: hypothetical protein Fur0046_36500 [Cyanobacteria bacterium J069]|nr:MAG: hypothetical protein D6742_14285 [Cyanobacteria bacterium J069]